MNLKVTISALVHPTEVRENVETALTNILPVELQLQDSEIPQLYGEGNLESLRKLHSLLRQQEILDTARKVLLSRTRGCATEFRLSKQVAFVGKVNFPAAEESLGSIHMEISAESEEELAQIIDWIAPQTSDGEPIEETNL